jgi:hypothetical protein
MHLRGYRDPGKVPEPDVEAIRDWLVLVNFHGYYSVNPSGRLQKDIETVKDSSGPSPSMNWSPTSRIPGEARRRSHPPTY